MDLAFVHWDSSFLSRCLRYQQIRPGAGQWPSKTKSQPVTGNTDIVNPDRCCFHCSMTLQLSWLEPLGPKAPPRPLLQFMLHRALSKPKSRPLTGLPILRTLRPLVLSPLFRGLSLTIQLQYNRHWQYNCNTTDFVTIQLKYNWLCDNTIAIQPTEDTIVVANATFTPTMIRLSPPPGLNPQNCLTHYHRDWNRASSTESYHRHCELWSKWANSGWSRLLQTVARIEPSRAQDSTPIGSCVGLPG